MNGFICDRCGASEPPPKPETKPQQLFSIEDIGKKVVFYRKKDEDEGWCWGEIVGISEDGEQGIAKYYYAGTTRYWKSEKDSFQIIVTHPWKDFLWALLLIALGAALGLLYASYAVYTSPEGTNYGDRAERE